MAQQGANGPGGQDAKKVALVFPSGLEKKGNALVLSDQGNNKIQAINLSTDQDISILGLTIQPGKLETLVTGPSFLPTEPSNPKAIVQDPDDANIFYIADSFSNRILKLEVDQRNVSVIAGNGLSRSEENKNGDGGEAINAVIGNPTSLAIWKDNNTKFLLVADNGSFKTVGGRQKTVGHVRIINLGTNDLSIGSVNGLQQNRIDTLIGGGGNSTFDLSGADPRTIQLEKITSVAVDTPESGKLPCIYVATYSSNLQQARILAFNPNGTGYDYDFTINGSNVQVQAGTVSTIAMEGGAGFLNNFQNNFQNPKSLGTFSSFGQISFLGGARPASSSQELVLFLPLADENLILAINYYSLAINLFGFILNSGEGTRICGRLATSGFFFPDNYGYNGDFISPKSALLANPTGVQYIAPTTASNNREMLLIADTDNGRIRAILGRGFPSSSKNLIVTFAGSGITGFNGDTLPSNDTHLSNPQGFWLYFMQVDSIYKPLLAICDSSNSRIRRVVPSFLVK
ncbi:MAG: hypothetical protein D6785_14745 [Planctomycetota bacterium]|nr:MAG: hypothetical protein D6785_14745 [Planctomycetota bacterium]